MRPEPPGRPHVKGNPFQGEIHHKGKFLKRRVTDDVACDMCKQSTARHTRSITLDGLVSHVCSPPFTRTRLPREAAPVAPGPKHKQRKPWPQSALRRQFRQNPLGHVGFGWGWKPSFIILRFWALAGPRLFLCRSTLPPKRQGSPPA